MAIKQPTDKSHFILPDLGEGVHEAELIKWRVQPGERVKEHQTLAEMETDKALVEVPSPWEGVVKELRGGEGDIITVGSILVTYETGAAASAKAPAKAASAKAAPAKASPAAHATSNGEGAREDAGTVVGSVDAGLKVPAAMSRARAAAPSAPTRTRTLATPAVRRIAREAGVDINLVPATGRGGRVTASDVEAFIAGGAPATTRAPAASAARSELPPPVVSADGVSERIPFRGVRRKIAESLDRSVKTAVHFTVVDESDVTTLDAKRREYAKVLGLKLSFLPFVITAVCRSLRAHPSLNAIVDDANGEILRKGAVNLGIAVDTDHGLMVPVIPSADRLGLAPLAEAVRTLAEGCRNRTIERDRLVGGSFTISNVGSYGGLFATPIINYPEVAILAVGRVHEKVMVKDGRFYAGKSMPLSLSCDHRVVDGAEGARFLDTVRTMLEDPAALLG